MIMKVSLRQFIEKFEQHENRCAFSEEALIALYYYLEDMYDHQYVLNIQQLCKEYREVEINKIDGADDTRIIKHIISNDTYLIDIGT